jgi:hypothetical protein
VGLGKVGIEDGDHPRVAIGLKVGVDRPVWRNCHLRWLGAACSLIPSASIAGSSLKYAPGVVPHGAFLTKRITMSCLLESNLSLSSGWEQWNPVDIPDYKEGVGPFFVAALLRYQLECIRVRTKTIWGESVLYCPNVMEFKGPGWCR